MDKEFRIPLIEIVVDRDRGAWAVEAWAYGTGPKKDGVFNMPVGDKMGTHWLLLNDAIRFAFQKGKHWVDFGMTDAVVIQYEGANDYITAGVLLDRTKAGGETSPEKLFARFPQLAEQGHAVPTFAQPTAK